MIPTEVSAGTKIGAGTEVQMNYGTAEMPDFKAIPGLLSSGDWGHDQEFVDDTDLADIEHTSIVGDRVAKEILLTLNHKPGNADQKTFLNKADANEQIQIKKVYTTGFTQTATFLLSLPYYSDPTRSEGSKVSVKGSPQGGIANGTVV